MEIHPYQQKLYELCIATEVKHYFKEMNVFQQLQKYGTTEDNNLNNNNEKLLFSECTSKRVQRLQKEVLSLMNENKNFKSKNFDVILRTCRTKITFCEKCETLIGFYTVWAQSDLLIQLKNENENKISEKIEIKKLEQERELKRNRVSLEYNKNYLNENNNKNEKNKNIKLTFLSVHLIPQTIQSPIFNELLSEKINHSPKIPLKKLTLLRKIADTVMTENNNNHQNNFSAAIQSIFQPPFPLSLECYPKHFLYFSVFIFFLYNMKKINPFSEEKEFKKMFQRLIENEENNNNNNYENNCCFPINSNDSILILGVGGNVVGKCLDLLFFQNNKNKNHNFLKLDVVEIERTIMKSGLALGQIPFNLSEYKKIENNNNNNNELWWAHTVELSAKEQHLKKEEIENNNQKNLEHIKSYYYSERINDYRFVIGDAHEFLNYNIQNYNNNNNNNDFNVLSYNIIYLDCYDPYREEMLFKNNKNENKNENIVYKCFCNLKDNGGVLVINAHVLPTVENLTDIFSFSNQNNNNNYKFAEIHALRVEGCDQCVLICVKDTNNNNHHQNLKKYSILNAKKVFRFLNQYYFKTKNFHLEENFLKSVKFVSNEFQIPFFVWSHH